MAGQADRDAGPDAPFNGILKMDHGNDATTVHHLGDDQVAGEPIFVPRTPDGGEDDGWLLSLVYSAPEHRSRLVVLDARDVESDPVTVAHLRHHVPLGFHGTFTSRVAEA
jgi:all-trans-8'-apo-beta-carotenal 15,15'-oxygenase